MLLAIAEVGSKPRSVGAEAPVVCGRLSLARSKADTGHPDH